MKGSRGFSLVEVVLALGIMSFGLLAIFVLLPVGLKSNQTSADEMRASNILTAVQADLTNTHPALSGTKSMLFGLQLPYALDSHGNRIINTTVTSGTSSASTVPTACTIGLDGSENPVPTATIRPPFQVSVIYTHTPVAGSLESMEARIIVNWPGLSNTSSIADLTNPSKVSGSIEGCVAFPAP